MAHVGMCGGIPNTDFETCTIQTYVRSQEKRNLTNSIRFCFSRRRFTGEGNVGLLPTTYNFSIYH